MKRLGFFLWLVICLIACGNGDLPADILPPKQMEVVLWDMVRADELADLNYTKDSTLKPMQLHGEQYDRVFAVHKLSREQLQKSLRYYESRPELLKPIIDTIHTRAERMTTGMMTK
jgi:hypothetical protein